VLGVVARRALRLTADDLDVLALAQEWSQRDPHPDIFAIPAESVDRMSTVVAIASLGTPVYRENNLLVDRSTGNLAWVTTTLVAPAGPFRYVSTVPQVGFLNELVHACARAGVPLDSIVVGLDTDVAYATNKNVPTIAARIWDLGLTQLRTDTVVLERVGDVLARFDLWLDDRAEAQQGRALDDTVRAAVVVLDPLSPHWSH
jgi:hypothetical protein